MAAIYPPPDPSLPFPTLYVPRILTSKDCARELSCSLASARIQPRGYCGPRLEAGGEKKKKRSRRRKSGGLYSPLTSLLGHRMTLLFPPATGLSSCPPIVPSYSAARPHFLRPTPYPVVSPGYSSVLLALSLRGGLSERSPFEPAAIGFLP